MIYLDHNATTPVLPEVFEAMRPGFCEEWDDPSSACEFGSKHKGVIESESIGTTRRQSATAARVGPGLPAVWPGSILGAWKSCST
jgi:cysteine sulfinate desulfinase/cysteine desulfurase-like protein